MSTAGGDLGVPVGIALGPVGDPIAFILDEHERQFDFCSRIENLISATEREPVGEWAASLLSFLTEDLPRHIKDEELDLFPMLNSRRARDESLGPILEQLVSEHEADNGLADLLIEDLKLIAQGATPNNPVGFFMKVRLFCETQRRHLNWENRVVLPLAEIALTDHDKQELAQRLANRRSKAEQT